MSIRTIYILAAVAIVQFAKHLPAALERYAGPTEVTVGVKDDQSEQ